MFVSNNLLWLCNVVLPNNLNKIQLINEERVFRLPQGL